MPSCATVSKPRLAYKRGPKSGSSLGSGTTYIRVRKLTVDDDSRRTLCAEHGEEADDASLPQALLDKESFEGNHVFKLVHSLPMEMLKVGS